MHSLAQVKQTNFSTRLLVCRYALSSASCIGVKGNRRDIRSRCDAHTSANWVGVKPLALAPLSLIDARSSAN